MARFFKPMNDKNFKNSTHKNHSISVFFAIWSLPSPSNLPLVRTSTFFIGQKYHLALFKISQFAPQKLRSFSSSLLRSKIPKNLVSLFDSFEFNPFDSQSLTLKSNPLIIGCWLLFWLSSLALTPAAA